MRKAKITINNEEYTMVLSTRVLLELQDKYGSADEGLATLLTSGDIRDAFWLLSLVLDAGYRYDKHNGIDAKKPPTLDNMIDVIGITDYAKMTESIRAITKAEPEVEIKSKNTGTSQADE